MGAVRSRLTMRRLATTLERELQADASSFRGCGGLDEAAIRQAAMLLALDRFAATDVSRVELSGHPGEAEDDERHRYPLGYHWGAELEACCRLACDSPSTGTDIVSAPTAISRSQSAELAVCFDGRNAGIGAVRSRSQARSTPFRGRFRTCPVALMKRKCPVAVACRGGLWPRAHSAYLALSSQDREVTGVRHRRPVRSRWPHTRSHTSTAERASRLPSCGLRATFPKVRGTPS